MKQEVRSEIEKVLGVWEQRKAECDRGRVNHEKRMRLETMAGP